MPINGQYTWIDKRDQVRISIPLKGIAPAKVDIFVTSSTLKVNYAPYIIDIILLKSIDAIKHKAVVKEGSLIVTLFKIASEPWLSLVNENIIDKDAVAEMKAQSLAVQSELENDLKGKRKDKKIDDERHSLRKQMALDEQERTVLDNLKQDEKSAAEKEIYETFAKMEKASSLEQSNHISGTGNVVVAAKKSEKKVDKKSVSFGNPSSESSSIQLDKRINQKEIFQISDAKDFNIDDYLDADDIDEDVARDVELPSRSKDDDDDDDDDDDREDEIDVKYIPPPRSTGISQSSDSRVGIQFTPRIFPTPMRESKLAEEEDWVAKNRKHLKKHGVLGSNIRKGNGVDISEEDPSWLKAKGDDFFRSGDARSAISAYTSALDADANMLSCYSNRSACYLKLSMLEDCFEDCSTGISKLESEALEANKSIDDLNSNNDSFASRAVADRAKAIIPSLQIDSRTMYIKLLLRRAAVLCQMGKFAQSLEEYTLLLTIFQIYHQPGKLHEAATLLNKIPGLSEQTIQSDIDNLLILMEAEQLKKEGDSAFAGRQLDEAIIKYSHALEKLPVHVSCLSNRAACRIALNDLKGCIEDCSAALTLLQIDHHPIDSGASANMIAAILPAPGTEKRKSWAMKTIVRRGMAYAQLGQIEEAIADYSLAVSIDPSNEALKSDLEKMRKLKMSRMQ